MLSQMDILVSYRPQYRGESSQSVIDAMRFGVVPVVRRIGWFDELPDDCVMKADSVDELPSLLDELRNDTKLRQQMSANAKKLIATQYSYEGYAKFLSEFILDERQRGNGVNERVFQALRNRQSLASLSSILDSSL